MSDTETINKAVTEWVKAGDDLSTIQKKLREELNCSKTFMEVRFLVDDLELELIDKKAEAAKAEAEKAAAEAAAGKAAPGTGVEGADAEVSEPELIDEGGAGGNVTVDVDAVVRPGAVISGSVTFSDGEKMGWQLDQMGQIGLLPGVNPDYRPQRADIEAFQVQLQAVLSQQGM